MDRNSKIPYSTSYLNKFRITHGLISPKTSKVFSPLHNKIHSYANNRYQNPYSKPTKTAIEPTYSSQIQTSPRYYNTESTYLPPQNLYSSYNTHYSYTNQSIPPYDIKQPPITANSIIQNAKYPLYESYINQTQPLSSSMIITPSSPTSPTIDKEKEDIMSYAEYLLSKLSLINKENEELADNYSVIERQIPELNMKGIELEKLLITLKNSEYNIFINNKMEPKSNNNAYLLGEKDKQIEELTKQVKQLEALNKETQASITEYETLMKQMKSNIKQLSNDCILPDKKASNETGVGIQNQLDELYKKYKSIQQENKEITNEYNELIKQKPSDTKNNIHSQYKQEAKNEVSASSEVIDYKEMFEKITKSNDELKESCNTVNADIQELINTREPMKQAYESNIDKMKKLLQSSSSQFSEMDQIISDNKELKKNNDELIKKIESLPNLEKTFEALMKENEQLREEFKEKYKNEIHEGEGEEAEDNGEEGQEEEDKQKEIESKLKK